ncbi:unnamed protein product [Brugia pahangi]|uniref:PRK domain-containing protein n=1 Tax=Brugia pahangi TaxID=6280 RepID=A0A0N4TBV5_BRUPA|nr:unnamed protein product [Brugia pahangi]
MDESISAAKSVTQIMKDFLSWPRRHEMHNEPINSGAYVLGIAGCSNSGKTTLSKTLSTAVRFVIEIFLN